MVGPSAPANDQLFNARYFTASGCISYRTISKSSYTVYVQIHPSCEAEGLSASCIFFRTNCPAIFVYSTNFFPLSSTVVILYKVLGAYTPVHTGALPCT